MKVLIFYPLICTASNGVVIATENKHKSSLYEEHSVNRVEMITGHIGMIYSGMGPDYRLLVKQARKLAQNYYLTYKEPIPVAQLVQRVATLMQEYTQTGYDSPILDISNIMKLNFEAGAVWPKNPNESPPLAKMLSTPSISKS